MVASDHNKCDLRSLLPASVLYFIKESMTIPPDPIYSLLAVINESHNWADILTAPPYALSIKENPDCAGQYIFKYSGIETKWMDPLCYLARAARGTILEIDGGEVKVICYPFSKFFNYTDEPADKIDFNTAIFTEKIDGSIIKAYYDFRAEKWQFATNSTFNLEATLYNNIPCIEEVATKHARTYQDLVDYAIGENGGYGIFAKLPVNYTLMFELVSPRNRIVLPYEKTELFFIGVRDISTFMEIDVDEFKKAYDLPFKTPKRYDFSNIEDIIFTDGAIHEGLVVRDAQFRRVKIKTEDYLYHHHFRGESVISKDKLFECMVQGTLDDIKSYWAEYTPIIAELEEQYSKVSAIMKECITTCLTYWERECVMLDAKEGKKKYAAFVLSAYPKTSFLAFAAIKEAFDMDELILGFIAKMGYERFCELGVGSEE